MSRPLVLLHGFTGAPSSWDEVLRLLGGDAAAAAFVPALLGHGSPASAPVPAVEDFEDEVDRLAGLVRGRGLGNAHLAGYSLGARLALGLLVRHPDLFTAATLIGVNPGLREAAERAERMERDEEWARLLEREGVHTFVAAWEALPLFASQSRIPAAALATQRRARLSHDPHGLARALRVVGLGRMPDYRPDLGSMEVPVRLVAGERDGKFRSLALEMTERLPRARVSIVGDAGHNVPLERPADVARLLSEEIQT